MRHVRLELTANGREREIHPMYDLLANGSCVAEAKTGHWNFSGEKLGIMHHVRGDRSAFRDAVEAIDEVRDYDLTRVDGERFYAYLMCVLTDSARKLFAALTEGRLVVYFPIDWRPDGTVSISVVGSSGDIHAAIDGVPDPVECEILEVGGIEAAAEPAEALISERQRETVESAVELGYYDVPRTAGVEDVADDIGCARSTAAEHLRKSEAKVFYSMFGE